MINKNEDYNMEIKEKNFITISLINSVLANIENQSRKNDSPTNNQINDKNALNQIIIKDKNNLMNSFKFLDNCFNYIKDLKKKEYVFLKRNINYLYKITTKRSNRIFKKIIAKNIDSFLALFITLLKNYINKLDHNNIRKILIIVIKLILDGIIPENSFQIIIEIFINILILIINENQDNVFLFEEEPFLLVDDIIESIIFHKKIKDDKLDNAILKPIINIFDKYLITPKYLNIDFNISSIWLKLLEYPLSNQNDQKMFNIIKDPEEQATNDDLNKIQIKNENGNNEENLQKKIYDFLINIYKFNMKDAYYQNNIIPKGINNLIYYVNSLDFLIELFKKEKEELNADSSFQI